MSAGGRDRDSVLPPEDDWFAEVSEPASVAPPPPRADRRDEPEPPPRGPARPQGRLLALAGVAAAVLLIAGGVILARALGDSDEPDGATPTLPTTAVTPPAPTPPPATTVETATPPPAPTTTVPGGTAAELPPDGTYRRGDQGDSVLAIQQALAALGFDPGDADGVFGAQTEEAVIAFQGSVDLTADGIVGPATLQALTQALAERG